MEAEKEVSSGSLLVFHLCLPSECDWDKHFGDKNESTLGIVYVQYMTWSGRLEEQEVDDEKNLKLLLIS